MQDNKVVEDSVSVVAEQPGTGAEVVEGREVDKRDKAEGERVFSEFII